MFQLPAISPFSLTCDPTTLGQRWKKWVTSLEYYILASNVTDPARKRAILLHLAGPEVQDLFQSFTEQGPTYAEAAHRLFSAEEKRPF